MTKYIEEKNKEANKAVVVRKLKTPLQDTVAKAKQSNDKEHIDELSLTIIAAKEERVLTEKVKKTLKTEKVAVSKIKKVSDDLALTAWLQTGIIFA